MAKIDKCKALIEGTVKDRRDMSTRENEQAVNPLNLQLLRDKIAAV